VNGFDGACAVGVAMKGLLGLTLGGEGKQIYGVATGSHAIDTFTPSAGQPLAQTGCLMSKPPPGPCSVSKLVVDPSAIAISPDGRNMYVADSSRAGGKIDVLGRDPVTGALSDASCVDFRSPPKSEEAGGEGGEPEEESKEEKEERAKEAAEQKALEAADPCTGVAGIENVESLAVSGDGSAVYAFGSDSAVSFSRNASNGALTETGCASNEDPRCSKAGSLDRVVTATVTPDGRDVYVATGAESQLVLAFGIGAAATGATATVSRTGIAHVSVLCPVHLAHPCSGRLLLSRAFRPRATRRGRVARTRRLATGRSAVFRISPGHRASVRVRLSRSALAQLIRRGRLDATASVRAARGAGGSAFGHRIVLVLRRR
jgi:DNA-binding beta-propeller fold protein YncE